MLSPTTLSHSPFLFSSAIYIIGSVHNFLGFNCTDIYIN